MQVNLHVNATTTPKVRAYIQASTAPVAELAEDLGVSEATVRKWRARKTVQDRSHRRKALGQSTSALEEALIAELRRDVGLSLDDITEVMKRCVNPSLSRSAIYRCLKRHGLSGRQNRAAPAAAKPFAPAPFGYVHMDLKHLPRLEKRTAYVFVAIERTTRFVYIEIIERRDAATIALCLQHFLAAFGYPVHTILTDNGSEFTDRFGDARWRKGRKTGTGAHPFDKLCAANGIKHKLTKPYHPQTNGMVERFNRRLSERLRALPAANTNNGKNKFETREQRNAFIHNFVDNYNRTRLQCLHYKAPLEMLSNQTEQYTFAGKTEQERLCRVRSAFTKSVRVRFFSNLTWVRMRAHERI